MQILSYTHHAVHRRARHKRLLLLRLLTLLLPQKHVWYALDDGLGKMGAIQAYVHIRVAIDEQESPRVLLGCGGVEVLSTPHDVGGQGLRGGELKGYD